MDLWLNHVSACCTCPARRNEDAFDELTVDAVFSNACGTQVDLGSLVFRNLATVGLLQNHTRLSQHLLNNVFSQSGILSIKCKFVSKVTHLCMLSHVLIGSINSRAW